MKNILKIGLLFISTSTFLVGNVNATVLEDYHASQGTSPLLQGWSDYSSNQGNGVLVQDLGDLHGKRMAFQGEHNGELFPRLNITLMPQI